MSELTKKMSKLTKKYDYLPIERTSLKGTRYYKINRINQLLPSVTTILSRTQSKEKQQVLENWRNRVGHKQAAAITSEAANRGTRLHNYLEDYIKDGVLKQRTSNPFSWPSHSMAEVIIANGIKNVDEVWGVEVPLYFPGIYAGTTDSVGVHKGEPAIMDYKQSNSRKKEEWIDDYKLQLAAYATAHNEVYGTNIKKGVIMMAVKPDVDNKGNVISEPEYQEFVVTGEDFLFWQQKWWQKLEEFYVKQRANSIDLQVN